MPPKKIIIDTDPGIDDAVAIAIALGHPELDVQLMTTVAGNVSLGRTTDNAVKLREFLKSDVPIAKGSPTPLLTVLEDASEFHGETGLDGYDFPPSSTEVLPVHAVEAMRQVVTESKEPVSILALGPLTNVAMFLQMYPELKPKLREIVYMGGSFARGNTSSVAEFNIYNDPHASEMVMRSGIPQAMISLDVTWQAVVKTSEIEVIRGLGDLGEMLYGIFSHYRGGSMATGLRMHDSAALAYLMQPDLFDSQLCFVETVLEGPARGATVRDLLSDDHVDKNVTICHSIDSERFSHWLVEALKEAAQRMDEGK